MDLDLEELAAIIELLEGADFTELRLQKGDFSLVVSRGEVAAPQEPVSAPAPAQPVRHPTSHVPASVAQPAAAQQPSSSSELADDEVLVTTPILGTFYRSPKPGEAVFVEVGDKVDPDSVVGIVEVMKLMNSVTAGVAGEVTRILASDGDLVEADQPLFALRTFA